MGESVVHEWREKRMKEYGEGRNDEEMEGE